MNLVIDDAVEVKQPTKAEPEPVDARRELGMSCMFYYTFFSPSDLFEWWRFGEGFLITDSGTRLLGWDENVRLTSVTQDKSYSRATMCA